MYGKTDSEQSAAAPLEVSLSLSGAFETRVYACAFKCAARSQQRFYTRGGKLIPRARAEKYKVLEAFSIAPPARYLNFRSMRATRTNPKSL